MASPGNQNLQQGGGSGPFDVQRLFNPPVSSSPSSQITNLQNPNNPYPPPPSSAASYPPPTATATATGGPYSYNPPQTNNPIFHHQFPPQLDNQLHSNLPHQRSLPYPTSPLQPPSPNNPNHGARLTALLSSPPTSTSDMQSQLPPVPTQNPNFNAMVPSSAPLLHPGAGPLRMPSNVRLAGEVQPQLEVTPITKYGSDPGLVVGRQIAVSKTYICYGLKPGTIRVLNINTASRSLLKGLAQRVTDMAFFADDVHLLASASMDGRVYVWKITEGHDEDDKPQITGKIVGEGEPVHPRVCWHCHKQIKIWEDRKSSPTAVLRPHDGLSVNSVTFLTAPHRPDHIILITGEK